MALTTNADFISDIMFKLGSRTDPDLRLKVVDELVLTKQRLERGRFLPWFLEMSGSIVISQGTQKYSLPSGFLREVEGRQLRFTGADGSKRNLKKALHSVLEEKYLNTTDGYPTWYSIAERSLFLFPTPSQAGTVNYYYYGAATSIPDNTDTATSMWALNAWDWFMAETAARISAYGLQNKGLADKFAQDAQVARNELYVHHESLKHTNADYTDDSEYLT